MKFSPPPVAGPHLFIFGLGGYTPRMDPAIFLLVLIACIAFGVKYFNHRQKQQHERKLPPGYDSITIKGNGLYQLEVVGESYYQDALKEICGPRTEEGVEKEVLATMVWEDDNPKDDLAVRIDIDGKTVGYLSKPFARLFRQTVADAGYGRVPTQCKAIITGGWDRGKRGKGNYGVRLDFPLYDSSKGEHLR